MSKSAVLLAANSSWNLVHFRKAIITGLQQSGYRVLAAVPEDDLSHSLRELSVEVHHVPVDARSLSPLKDARMFLAYRNLLRRLRPQAFLGFTAKPNIYGSIAAAGLEIPVINTITGLGTAFLSGRGLERVVSILYSHALVRSRRVFFHNSDDRNLFLERGLVRSVQACIVAGSGIDLKRFSPAAAPARGGPPAFLFIGRLLQDKGAMEFAEAAAIVRKSNAARFQVLGTLEEHPKSVPHARFMDLVRNGAIEMLGITEDVRPAIAAADCVVLPSYREGLPRVLLEASAMARPAIATDVPGCRQALDHGLTGLLCESKSTTSLAKAISSFIEMSPVARAAMGSHARQKAEREFSQERVVEAYLDALRQIR